jgi:hypothetical protein
MAGTESFFPPVKVATRKKAPQAPDTVSDFKTLKTEMNAALRQRRDKQKEAKE